MNLYVSLLSGNLLRALRSVGNINFGQIINYQDIIFGLGMIVEEGTQSLDLETSMKYLQ